MQHFSWHGNLPLSVGITPFKSFATADLPSVVSSCGGYKAGQISLPSDLPSLLFPIALIPVLLSDPVPAALFLEHLPSVSLPHLPLILPAASTGTPSFLPEHCLYLSVPIFLCLPVYTCPASLP